jgi:hypothetical protein
MPKPPRLDKSWYSNGIPDLDEIRVTLETLSAGWPPFHFTPTGEVATATDLMADAWDADEQTRYQRRLRHNRIYEKQHRARKLVERVERLKRWHASRGMLTHEEQLAVCVRRITEGLPLSRRERYALPDLVRLVETARSRGLTVEALLQESPDALNEVEIPSPS